PPRRRFRRRTFRGCSRRRAALPTLSHGRQGGQSRQRKYHGCFSEELGIHGHYLIGNFCPPARCMNVVCSEPAALLPSFARAAASTVTLSPIFTVSRFQPPRVS